MGSIVEIEGYEDKQLNERVQQNSIKQKWETKNNLLCIVLDKAVCLKNSKNQSFIDTAKQLQPGKKYFAKSKTIKQNSTRLQDFDICFCLSVWS